jgi:iron(III) transport system substrate-binding protein
MAVTRTLKRGLVSFLMAAAVGAPALANAAEVNIYSYRKEALIRPLLDAFTEKTGIEVNLLTGKADVLLQRLKSEGMNSPADVLLTVDAGRLVRAKEAGVLQPIKSETLESLVPAKLRDPEGYWVGLSQRARVILRSKDRVEEGAIETYDDLADPKWKGKICIRSSGNIYNQSLLASLIANEGEETAENWAKGVVANMARKPQGGDRDQIKAVAAGECDIAVANTYYYAGMLEDERGDQREAAEKVAIVFPNQEDRGTHVNISGGGVTKSAKHKDEAVKLLEFLASDDAQALYAQVVNEYPLRDDIELDATLKGWGAFKADDLDLVKLGELNGEAVRIFDRAGWR